MEIIFTGQKYSQTIDQGFFPRKIRYLVNVQVRLYGGLEYLPMKILKNSLQFPQN